MIYKKTLLKKILALGGVAEFHLVMDQGEYKAMLFVNGNPVHGPPIPCPLDQPKGDITHWMGNKPSVGLTLSEAEDILKAIRIENLSLQYYREMKGK